MNFTGVCAYIASKPSLCCLLAKLISKNHISKVILDRELAAAGLYNRQKAGALSFVSQFDFIGTSIPTTRVNYPTE